MIPAGKTRLLRENNMDVDFEKLLKAATLQDDASCYQCEEYNRIGRTQNRLYLTMLFTFGEEFVPLMSEFLSAAHDEVQFERREAFRLGYQTKEAEIRVQRKLREHKNQEPSGS